MIFTSPNSSESPRNGGRLCGDSNPPVYELDICGVIRAKELRVNLLGCDFVFDENYNLKSLKEVEKFIILKKHLPGIPSANEMQTSDGVEVGNLLSKLLQKVEELTLYIIEQDKKIERLTQKVDNFNK